MSIDWSKYGINDEKKKNDIDWSKYQRKDEVETVAPLAPKLQTGKTDLSKKYAATPAQKQATTNQIAAGSLGRLSQGVETIADKFPTKTTETPKNTGKVTEKSFVKGLLKSGVEEPLKIIDTFNADLAEKSLPRGKYLGGQKDELGYSGPLERLRAENEKEGLHTTGNKTLDAIKEVYGSVGSFVSNPAKVPGINQLQELPLGRMWGASIGESISNPLLSRVSTGAARELTTGAMQGAAYGLQTGDGSIKDIAKETATGALSGAVLGGLGGAFSTALQRLKGTSIGNAFENFMGRSQSIPAELETAARQAVDTADNPTGRTLLKDLVTERMTPPLENPNELAKWLQPHLGESLNEIRKLPYDDMVDLATEVRNNLKTYDVAEQVARERGVSVDDVLGNRVDPMPYPTVSEPNMGTIAPEPKVALPETPQPMQRGFVNTVQQSEKASPELRQGLNSTYEPISNQTTVDAANARVAQNMRESTAYVLGNSEATAEKVATGLRLMDEYTKTGNHEMAVTIAEKLAQEGTRLGQSVQAFSIYNRLSPEGVLIHAQRIAQKTNESLSRIGKEVKVTPEMAANITDLAQTTQKMTGVKDLSNDVMDILDRAKSGAKLTDTETATLRKFVQESKQFVKEVERKPKSPDALKPPRKPRDKRVQANLISFLDAQESAAKERLRSKGIQISSTPLDVWADYAIIGAAKMAKGTIRFADWSADMVREFGDEIKPSLKSLYERSKQAFNESTKKVSKTTISNAERLTENVIKNKQLDKETAKNLRKLATNVSQLSGSAKTVASQDLQVILQQLDKPGIGRRLSTLQTTSQLFNPKTHVRNALGNELFYRLERINKYVATPIDIARSKITGSERTVTFKRNGQENLWEQFINGAKNYASDFVQGGRAGWKGVSINGLETQFDLKGQSFKGKWNPATFLEKSLGAALRSFDNASYMRAVRNTIGEMSVLRATNEGLTGEARNTAIAKYIREADENLLGIADEYGKYVTFQDNNIVSKGLTSFKRGLNLGKNFGLGDLVLKYPKTPGALLMRALEYSPAGFLRSAKIAAEPFFRKSVEPNAREATQALSRAIVGTFGMTGLGYYFLDKGIITGAASKDKDIRDLQRSAGQGQYQVNLSALSRWVKSGFSDDAAKLQQGDNLYTYDWMQPVSIAISLGANVRKNQLSGDAATKGLLGTAYDSFDGGINTLVEQSVLSGLKDAAQGYPGQTVSDKIVDILSDLPSSFVPTAANQIRTLTDNKKRETYDPNVVQQSLNRATSKLPKISGLLPNATDLPQQYDTLGRPKTTMQNNSFFNVLLNPGNTSRYQLTPTAEYIVNLINETGDETLAPRVPGKKIDGTALTTEQFARLQQLQGEETNKRLDKMSKSGSLEAQQKRVKKVLNKSTEQAKKQLLKEYDLK